MGGVYRDAVLKAGNLYRLLFTTGDGYIGMGSDGVREGDVVVVPEGGQVPVVLRPVSFVFSPVPEAAAVYRLICDCYIHGFMEGEAFQRGDSYGGLMKLGIV